MGYHTAAEIPNYWAYARDFVLQDHMFQSDLSWSLPSHLYMVSAWSAFCSKAANPMSCVNQDSNIRQPPIYVHSKLPPPPGPDFAWTDITYLLHRAGVSWGYYVFPGTQPDCADGRHLEPAPVLRHREAGRPTGGHPASPPLLPRRPQRNAAGRLVDRARRRGERTPAFEHRRRRELRDRTHQHDHARATVEVDGDFSGLGRLGRLLRSCTASAGRPERLRTARARPRNQPVREEGVHRPSDAELRRVPQVHRGRLPRQPATQPQDRRQTGSSARRTRKRTDPREPRQRLQLQPDPSPPGAPPTTERGPGPRARNRQLRDRHDHPGIVATPDLPANLLHGERRSIPARQEHPRGGFLRHLDLLWGQVRDGAPQRRRRPHRHHRAGHHDDVPRARDRRSRPLTDSAFVRALAVGDPPVCEGFPLFGHSESLPTSYVQSHASGRSFICYRRRARARRRGQRFRRLGR